MRVAVFYLLCSLAVVFGLLAVTRRNPIHSALMLVLSLLSLAGVYLALGAAFLAMAQIFVYAGAIMVLFLFVIMFAGTTPATIAIRAREGYLYGVATVAVLFIVFAVKLIPGPVQESVPAGASYVRPVESSVRELAAVLIGTASNYGEHALAFELGSVLVLLALVGAVLLTRKRS